MTKIIFTGISGYDYPHVRVRCYNFASEVAKHGYETEVLSFRDHLGPHLSEQRMYGLSDRWKLILSARALKFLFKRRGTVLYLQKIHFHSAVPVLLARLGVVKLIFDLDDWDETCLSLFRLSILNKLFFGSSDYTTIVAKVSEKAEFCVVASHALKEILDKFSERVHLLHTGVDSEKFNYYERPDKPEIICGWTGLIWGDTVFNSTMMMLEAFSKAYSNNDRLRLRIIGAGQMMPLFKQRIENDFSELPVEIIDWVHPDKMVDELRQFDIGLLPLKVSDSDELWVKSKSPTKYFEYLSTGLATVASDMGEVCYVVKDGENGFLAPDVDCFAEKILLLANNYEFRIEMGRKARQSIEGSFNLTALGSRLSSLLDQWKKHVMQQE